MNDDIRLVIDALEHTSRLTKRFSPYRVSVVCPICGEGNKRHDHSHCYIGPYKDNPPLVYHCFIGECSGVVTPMFLRDMGIYDLELETILNTFNRSYSNMDKASRKIYRIKKVKENLVIPKIQDNPDNQYKLRYMQARLGVKFTYENLEGLKVIFSLRDFLEQNNISPNMKYKGYNRTINNDYIGFLDTLNNYIVFRNTKDNKNLRYVKYDLFDLLDTSSIIYAVPGTQSDLFADTVNLNIAEGPFDALGVFCNVKKFNRENNIYAACCGSGYLRAIKYFIKLGFIGNLIVNIYSDADKPVKYYKHTRVFDEIQPWVKDIRIYYNEKGKDYGVPRKYISVTQALI